MMPDALGQPKGGSWISVFFRGPDLWRLSSWLAVQGWCRYCEGQITGKIILCLGAGALLCYEATSSLFRAVSFQNWRWLLMRSMVCKLNEGCEETLVLIETGEGKQL